MKKSHLPPSLFLVTLMAACSGSVMGPKEKKSKNRPVVVGTPPSSSSSSAAPRPRDSSPKEEAAPVGPGHRFPRRDYDGGREGDRERDQPKYPELAPPHEEDSDCLVAPEENSMILNWEQPRQASGWVNYIFSDLESKERSQAVRSSFSVDLQVRSVGVVDALSENHVNAALTFRTGNGSVRVFKTSRIVVVKKERDSDVFVADLGSRSAKDAKIFRIELTRRHVDRHSENLRRQVNRSPWSGKLYSVVRGEKNLVGRLHGLLGCLSLEQFAENAAPRR